MGLPVTEPPTTPSGTIHPKRGTLTNTAIRSWLVARCRQRESAPRSPMPRRTTRHPWWDHSAKSARPSPRRKVSIAASATVAAVLACSTPASEPALVVGQGLPTEINGQPCHYRRKEVARVGHYINRGRPILDASGNTVPDQWEEFDITSQRMNGWIDAFNRRKAAGIKPFVPERHVASEPDARANFGYVIGMDRKGDKLYGTFQLIGDEALAAAAETMSACMSSVLPQIRWAASMPNASNISASRQIPSFRTWSHSSRSPHRLAAILSAFPSIAPNRPRIHQPRSPR